MKKHLYLIIALILLFPTLALAKNEAAGASNETPRGNQVQNQINTQNAGEETQLKVNTQESLNAGEAVPQSQRSEQAREHMSEVAEQVEEILAEKQGVGGIGEQVRAIAKAQSDSQQLVSTELDNLQGRKGVTKKIFGPDYKALKNLGEEIKQNQLRIRELNQLQIEVSNQAEATQIESLIKAMNEQNTALTAQIEEEQEVGSVLGWFFKLFYR